MPEEVSGKIHEKEEGRKSQNVDESGLRKKKLGKSKAVGGFVADTASG